MIYQWLWVMSNLLVPHSLVKNVFLFLRERLDFAIKKKWIHLYYWGHLDVLTDKGWCFSETRKEK